MSAQPWSRRRHRRFRELRRALARDL